MLVHKIPVSLACVVAIVAWGCKSDRPQFGGPASSTGGSSLTGAGGMSGGLGSAAGGRDVGGSLGLAGMSGQAGSVPELVSDGPPARLVSPLSTSFAGTQRPTLLWKLPLGASNPSVEFCRDRSCTNRIDVSVDLDTAANSAKPTNALPQGVVYWRVKAKDSKGVVTSAPWQVRIPSIAGAVDTSWGSALDMNADGYTDLLSAGARVRVHPGSAQGLGADPVELTMIPDLGEQDRIVVAGDVNGDGFADVAVKRSDAGGDNVWVFLGSQTFDSRGPWQKLDFPGNAVTALSSVGDFNGDGYADLAIALPKSLGVQLYLGGRDKLEKGPTAPLGGGTLDARLTACDINGDRLGDLVVASQRSTPENKTVAGLQVLRWAGGAVTSGNSNVSPGFGRAACVDLNGDGYPEVYVGDPYSDAHGYSNGDIHVFENTKGTLSDATSLKELASFANPGGSYAEHGYHILATGDLDGDGVGDLAFGGQYFVHVLFSSTGTSRAVASIPPPETFSSSDYAAGDFNGDGFSDLAVLGSTNIHVYAGGAMVRAKGWGEAKTVTIPAVVRAGAAGVN